MNAIDMKSYIAPILLLVIAMNLFASCNQSIDEISGVAYQYCLATSEYRFDDADLYCTDETRNTTLPVAKNIVSLLDKAYIEKDSPVTIDIISVTPLSDTEAYVVYHKHTPLKEFTDTLEMRKRADKWLAHAPIIKNKAIAQ